jgi:transketolase
MAEELHQRDVYGATLKELGAQDPNIVVLDADLSSSTKTSVFAKAFPERFFNFGVAEQNMMACAAGLASCGKTVFASSFAMFATGRAWEQVRNAVAYNNFNVKIVATHAGVTVGPDGASHQALEDLCLMRAIPGITVVVPCDGPQVRDAITAAAAAAGPFYVRLARCKVPTIEHKPAFALGRAQVLAEGDDAAIIACGIMVHEALAAAAALAKRKVRARVLNVHTIRPLDTEAVLACARTTKGIVVCEEHSVIGGLAAAVQEAVSAEHPCRVIPVGVANRFGQSGEPQELMKEYGLTCADIEKAVLSIVS